MTLPNSTDTAEYLRAATDVAAAVADPELPFLTLHDLGILREVVLDEGIVVARLSPTYSGCPAVSVIENSVKAALEEAGFPARVERVMSPPWTTVWITEAGRQKLLDNGIAPPTEDNNATVLFAVKTVVCPACESSNTKKISEFGSTPCKAQYRCENCLEPFDYFKCH